MTSTPQPLAPCRAAASPEQRAACLHPPDDRAPVSGDGWLCCFCGADCAPPEKAPAELTAERLDELDRRARDAAERASKATAGPWEALDGPSRGLVSTVDESGPDIADVLEPHIGGPHENATFIAAAREDVSALSAALQAATAEIRRLREPPKLAPGQAEDVEHLALLALAEPDEERDCLRCRRTMASPDRSEGEEATPLCHACAQAVLPKLAAEVQRLRATRVVDADRVLASVLGKAARFVAEGARGESCLIGAMSLAEQCARTARGVRLGEDPESRRDLLIASAAWAIAAIREIDRAEALASGEPPRAGEEEIDG
ncbi:hypothetical protein WMF30_10795 [Sorangium sp. So ce134]